MILFGIGLSIFRFLRVSHVINNPDEYAALVDHWEKVVAGEKSFVETRATAPPAAGASYDIHVERPAALGFLFVLLAVLARIALAMIVQGGRLVVVARSRTEPRPQSSGGSSPVRA